MTAQYRQHVPRPEGARRGAPPKWTEIDASARAHIPVARVRDAFALHRLPEFAVGSAAAAVLVPIQELDGEASVLLIRRADDLVTDPGHIAFPGGHVEADEPPLDAALRETEEEIGLFRSEVEVIGAFPAIGRRQGEGRVAPFVGVISERPALTPDHLEVAEVIEVPIASLASDGASWQEVWSSGADEFEMTFFAGIPELRSELVWGLSARILAMVLSRVLTGGQKPSE
ncbi:MAG: CoA pyrophosphatase [Acidimicrobiales bacterium]